MTDESVLHELFPEGIYLIPDNPTDSPEKDKSGEISEPEKAETAPLFKGGNKKNIVVLYDQEATLSSDQDAFLLKVMEAVDLRLEDIALVYLPENKNWPAIPANKVLLFNCSSLKSTDLNDYVPIISGDQNLLYCESLETIMNDRARKGKLWNALKLMFGL